MHFGEVGAVLQKLAQYTTCSCRCYRKKE
jgi:hypothetical protein